jgi:hypothetical protein
MVSIMKRYNLKRVIDTTQKCFTRSNVIKLLQPLFTHFHNKLTCLFLADLSSKVWTRAYPRVEHVLHSGRLRPYSQTLDSVGKTCLGIAYYKNYSRNLEIFVVRLLSPMFASKARACQCVALSRCSSLG